MRKFLFSNSDTLPWGHNSRWKHGFYPNALRNGVENSVDDICQSKNLMSLFWRSHRSSHNSHLSTKQIWVLKKQRKTAANRRIPQNITGCWLLVTHSQGKWAAKSVDATYVIHTYGGQVMKDRKVLTGLNKHHSAVKQVNHSPPACALLKIFNLLHE